MTIMVASVYLEDSQIHLCRMFGVPAGRRQNGNVGMKRDTSCFFIILPWLCNAYSLRNAKYMSVAGWCQANSEAVRSISRVWPNSALRSFRCVLRFCLPVDLYFLTDVIGQFVGLGGSGERERCLRGLHRLVEFARCGISCRQCFKNGRVLMPC